MDLKTRCVHGTGRRFDYGRPLAPAIVPASTYLFDDQAGVERFYEQGEGYLYSRYDNPTVRRASMELAALEGAEDAALFGSGMAAISTTVLTLAGPSRRIAAQTELYGGTAELMQHLLPELGIEVLSLDREEIARLSPETLEGCGLFYLETPVNPTLRLVDLRRAAATAHEAGVPVAVDGTFASPALQRPVEHGVDLVLHSTTKYLGGHSDLIGGAVAGRADLVQSIKNRRRILGGVADAFSAFLLLRGLRTLAVRMEAHCRAATAVAEFLVGHPQVESVHYPGLVGHPDRELLAEQMSGPGGIVSFCVRGGAEEARRVHDRLELFHCAGSLGSVESLVSIPARMSHRHLDEETLRRIGVPANMLRLSVGIESPADLVADLDQALATP